MRKQKHPGSFMEYAGNTTRPGNPIWDEYVDKRTGKSTLEIHEPKDIPFCKPKDHNFQLLDANGNVQCSNCPSGTRIVWGLQFLKKGKIVNGL